ncbi:MULTISPECIES: hypothetical protein [Diaphorobacter]|uniref:Carbohydrate ABC transporter permease n=1 Tax=Diaphorobacter nitroreducens TaxID=164759 RepID=A0AAX1WUI0_9BURK|nr:MULTISPECIES: hypothetical protein [Diaphorobacter]ROR47364.1 hypothetical protein EDC60_2093 [Diaphorobacter nitroreducens]WKK91168.1 hypothetical protein QY917_08455 [Diaphorobacter sp. C33]
MPPTKPASGEVPHSSGRNRVATSRTVTLLLIAVAVMLLFLWAPW